MSDIEIVRQCLKEWRWFAYRGRYGGLGENLKQTDEALEALDRLEQPALFQVEATEDEKKAEPTPAHQQ